MPLTYIGWCACVCGGAYYGIDMYRHVYTLSHLKLIGTCGVGIIITLVSYEDDIKAQRAFK